MEYKPTIGLEVHAELSTKTKMFCACKNDPDEVRPNVNVCPICMGHPGTLPVINKEAVKNVLRVGHAVNGMLATTTEFDRKNYFYPDIPKGYQISQYKHPLVSGGELAGVKLTRIHLEEDTGVSQHDKGDYSLVNYNRAGVPLMELVTEPVIHSGEEAGRFARELQLLLQYLGVAEANMEKGEMRVEVNISLAPQMSDLKDSDSLSPTSGKLGTKVEIKNLNSFKAAERAIEYEIKRQGDLLDKGGRIEQETRGWNEARQETFSQRKKEDSHDYRYFPDPDLPKLDLTKLKEFDVEVLKTELGETPAGKRARLAALGIKDADVEFYIQNPKFAEFFETVVRTDDNTFNQLASNYIVSDMSALGGVGKVGATSFGELIDLITGNKISSRGAKDVLAIMFEQGGTAEVIAKENNLLQVSDTSAIEKIVEEVISNHEKIVDEYRAGKQSSLQFLIGQGMKLSKGSANPQLLKQIIEEKLN